MVARRLLLGGGYEVAVMTVVMEESERRKKRKNEKKELHKIQLRGKCAVCEIRRVLSLPRNLARAPATPPSAILDRSARARKSEKE